MGIYGYVGGPSPFSLSNRSNVRLRGLKKAGTGAGMGAGMGTGLFGERRGSDFIYTKNLRATGIEFHLHKEFLTKNHEKLMMYSKNFPRCARSFFMGAMLMKIVILPREKRVCRVPKIYESNVVL